MRELIKRALYAKTCPRCDKAIAKGAPIAKRGGDWVCLLCGQEGRE